MAIAPADSKKQPKKTAKLKKAKEPVKATQKLKKVTQQPKKIAPLKKAKEPVKATQKLKKVTQQPKQVKQKPEDIFNTVGDKLPISVGDDPWTYELFIGVTREQLKELIANLSIQQQSKLRTLYNKANPEDGQLPRRMKLSTELLEEQSPQVLFFTLCRSLTFHEGQDGRDDKIFKLTSDDGRIEAYMLPNNIDRWPSFYATKQESEDCPHIYFKRVADSHSCRFNETVRLLCDRKKVISSGLSGIGKSTEVNGLLMVFLSHLGETGWPKELWYRYDCSMLMYTLSDAKTPQVRKVAADTVVEILKYTQPYQFVKKIEDSPVLLLELRENESDPMSYIPTYIPLSNRDVYSLTKEMSKSRCNYLLVDPPTCKDIQTMAVMESQLNSASGIVTEISKDEIKRSIKERVDIVGPKLRDVFVSQNEFDQIKEKLKDNVSKVFGDLGKVSMTDMPDDAKNYLGVFVAPGTFIPSITSRTTDMPEKWYSIRFLSDYIAKLVAQSCSEDNRQKLVTEKFDYLVAEAIMCHGLMIPELSKFMDEAWTFEKWIFYRDVGPAAKLTSADREGNPEFRLCKKVICFANKYLDHDVSKLEEETLYRCSLHNGALYDAMLVCHPTETERGVVYAFQSSNLRANKHSLDCKTIKDVMDNLHFGANVQYDLCYVYCSDTSSKSETGCNLTNSHGLAPDVLNAVKNRLIIKIARVCYYPNAQHNII